MGRGEQAARAAKKPVKAAEQTSLFQGLAAAQGQLNDSSVSWTKFLGLALLAGVTFGSLIQVSHNNPNLPVGLPDTPRQLTLQYTVPATWYITSCVNAAD